MKKLYALFGPTGSGKTHLLFENLNQKEKKFEVISVDSRQIYKTISIGTAAPTKEVLEKIPHHLVQFLEPYETFSAGEFKRKAQSLIEEIYKRNHIPILCGGTGFYFKAFYTGMFSLQEIDPIRKQEIEQFLATLTLEQKREILFKIDPLSFTLKNEEMGKGRFHPNDSYRIQRSLELFYLTGKTLRMHYENPKMNFRYDYEIEGFYLNLSLKDLEKKIYERAKKMVQQGMIEEAISLYKNYGECNAMKTPGYREIINIIKNRWNYLEIQKKQIEEIQDQVIEILFNAHKKYAKAQIKWFKKEKMLRFVNEIQVKEFLQKLEANF